MKGIHHVILTALVSYGKNQLRASEGRGFSPAVRRPQSNFRAPDMGPVDARIFLTSLRLCVIINASQLGGSLSAYAIPLAGLAG